LARPNEPHHATLLWHRGDGATVEFPLPDDARTVVGRDGEAPIRIEEPLVSRHHAEIAFEDGHYVVRDLGSTNRTRVNGLVIAHSVLAHGDELLFARARCTFSCPTPPPAEGAALESSPEHP
jgi:hypothetical protein